MGLEGDLPHSIASRAVGGPAEEAPLVRDARAFEVVLELVPLFFRDGQVDMLRVRTDALALRPFVCLMTFFRSS